VGCVLLTLRYGRSDELTMTDVGRVRQLTERPTVGGLQSPREGHPQPPRRMLNRKQSIFLFMVPAFFIGIIFTMSYAVSGSASSYGEESVNVAYVSKEERFMD
jgi:hypothetical protein